MERNFCGCKSHERNQTAERDGKLENKRKKLA